MTIPSKITVLIARLDQELEQTERTATEGLNLVRRALLFFPNNAIVVQFFAYFNTALLFVETYKRQIQTTVEAISSTDVPEEVVQEAGEDLATLSGD